MMTDDDIKGMTWINSLDVKERQEMNSWPRVNEALSTKWVPLKSQQCFLALSI